MTRKEKRRREKEMYENNRVVFTIIAICLIALTAIAIFETKRENNVAYEMKTKIVSKGDTLWSIAHYANDLSFKERDVRQIIDEIESLNELESSMIHPGQEILIPVSVPKN